MYRTYNAEFFSEAIPPITQGCAIRLRLYFVFLGLSDGALTKFKRLVLIMIFVPSRFSTQFKRAFARERDGTICPFTRMLTIGNTTPMPTNSSVKEALMARTGTETATFEFLNNNNNNNNNNRHRPMTFWNQTP